MKFYLGKYNSLFTETLNEIKQKNIINRIWEKDYTVWRNDPAGISNRLGWLTFPNVMISELDEIENFVQSIIADGITDVLLLGMGGSSLAPEVFSKTFKSRDGYPNLYVLDSTHPGVITDYSEKLNPETTLYIVSTKSGGTVETLSFMKFFYKKALKILGKNEAGKHFTAITDPNSRLIEIAEKLNFRKIFLNDPDIGGRYSVLSFFGLVPAALIGVDLKKLLEITFTAINNSKQNDFDGQKQNSAAKLGAALGALANVNVDKLTFFTSRQLSFFCSWVEQLIAESTGKEAKGILPVVNEAVLPIEAFGEDRLFIYLYLSNENEYEEYINKLRDNNYPVITIELSNIYDLGSEFFRWEFATALAGWKMNIQPFNQPNVESTKIAAKEMVEKYELSGKLPEVKQNIEDEEFGISLDTDEHFPNVDSAFQYFFDEFSKIKNGYIAIQAYIKPVKKTDKLLEDLRICMTKKFNCAATFGYGPRFLHSTGQLHKGDKGNGFFIQIVENNFAEVKIPDEAGNDNSSITFGVLITAQSLGDRKALIDNNRNVLRINLLKNTISGLERLTQKLCVAKD